MLTLLIINHSSLVDVQKGLELTASDLKIPVEFSNETDERLAKYVKRSDRFPVYILFKNNIKLDIKQGRYNSEKLNSWINSLTPLK